MNLKIGIVGLPNAGKSTLFNALLKKNAAIAENYPFCTIEPNTGIVNVPDARLDILAKIVKTTRIVPATVEFVDIAGLVKGAHKGEGLGNKFLSHIREVSAICYVLRFFEDDNVVHVASRIDPIDDLAILEDELMLADLATLEKYKPPKGKPSKEDIIRAEAVQKLKNALKKAIPARRVTLTDGEAAQTKQLMLLTLKPTLCVANMSEAQFSHKETLMRELTTKTNAQPIALNARLEAELIDTSTEERTELLASVGIESPALENLSAQAYKTLNLMSFLTAGELEARAWTIQQGTLAPQAAGVIHSDFEQKFIKADIVNYADFVAENGWLGSRQKGLVHSMGKEYVMQEGDVVEFKIGV
ncbi:redox-regulated ATPase YchF [Candidatus Roizmanbacteria bacterium CG10_big_fil_rev_8_21_14_0_10_39_6]|uniref:Ribosome-binding ATPase YchF n=1 Tax=Candidatus Roizmanbacteria bacterium CG10_big_fil_rev_8_21_14_0_10_39_6 TaxID=1974853 RepID=A0A2M8KSU5_9BACT|nr:MAG: redox-regulated ATPase YchF [Candidatus Roizmanbacteria bacterium CG10_big_fil_rev_8_21_14_0_10_39_6]